MGIVGFGISISNQLVLCDVERLNTDQNSLIFNVYKNDPYLIAAFGTLNKNRGYFFFNYADY